MMVTCDLCPNMCDIAAGGVGACRARGVTMHPCTREENVVSLSYGKLTSVALDPIEKKPLNRFYPGSMILSVGSFGCNLRCPWCQNHGISMAKESDVQTRYIAPDGLAGLVEEYMPKGNIGVAFTYNEPLVSFEYVYDTSKILRRRGMKSVLVTNGCANPGYFEKLLPFIDAMNIDLKSINPDFYKKIGGDLTIIQNNIRAAAERCHVELTCLLINGENDSRDEMEEMTDFIAGVSPEIPFHISRFFPQYRMRDRAPTDIRTLERFAEIARGRLSHVYLGNV